MRTEATTQAACERVTVDTTVQTKAVAHPTDSHLLMRGIEWLNRLAKRHGIKLRQSFLRVGRRARRDVSRLIHGRGHKQAMRWVRKLRTRSEEHTSELQSLMRISYAVFCLKKKNKQKQEKQTHKIKSK